MDGLVWHARFRVGVLAQRPTPLALLLSVWIRRPSCMSHSFSHYFVRRYCTNYIPASVELRQVLLVSIFSCVRDKYQRRDLINFIISLFVKTFATLSTNQNNFFLGKFYHEVVHCRGIAAYFPLFVQRTVAMGSS